VALKAIDETHAAQILAGTEGRNYGHRFEERLAAQLTMLGKSPFEPKSEAQAHLVEGWPAVELLAYIARHLQTNRITKAEAWWVGGLATGAGGTRVLGDTNLSLDRSKSDVVVRLSYGVGDEELIGIGVKTCNNPKPTNAQLYFTTATSFIQLLRRHEIPVDDNGLCALRMFCGDNGFRPIDSKVDLEARAADPDRWFWEELRPEGRAELERVFTERQDDVTRTLLAFAYEDDPIPPRIVLHVRQRASTEAETPLAIYSVDELVGYSRAYGSFSTRPYRITKGRFRNDPATHEAPRFGFVQMQRGGQRQHPTQLQFNLKAGYFNQPPVSAVVP
jgi:hypothetical protein